MRMDLLQSKSYHTETVRYQKMLIGAMSLAYAFFPLGYIFILPVLLFLALADQGEHYVAMMFFVIGSFIYGWQHGFVMIALLLGWNVVAQLATFSIRHQASIITFTSMFLSLLTSWYLTMPWSTTMMMMALQFGFFELMRNDFPQANKQMQFSGSILILLGIAAISQNVLDGIAAAALMNGILLLLSMLLPNRKIMYLALLMYMSYFIPSILPVSILKPQFSVDNPILSMLPLLLSLCLPQDKLKRWVSYIALASAIFLIDRQLLALLYYLTASLLIWVSPKADSQTLSDMDVIDDKERMLQQANRNTQTLLHRFSVIFDELAKRNPSLTVMPVVAASFQLCEDELKASSYMEKELKRKVEDALFTYHFPVHLVTVEKHEVILIHLRISKLHPSELAATLIPLLVEATGLALHLVSVKKAGFFDSYHRITLSSTKGLSLLYDQIQQPFDQECGDAILVKTWQEQMHFMLSDGMGSGASARSQSTFVLSMIDQLIEASVPIKTAIKLVNQLALLQSEERYATLDALSIDRFQQQALLYKSGGMQTYLLRNKIIYSFFGASLPLGIVERIDPDHYAFKLKSDDVILMVSDGADHEKMKEWMTLASTLHPAKMLRFLYEQRISEMVDDDISMLLVRVK